jgi:hypothetical protein
MTAHSISRGKYFGGRLLQNGCRARISSRVFIGISQSSSLNIAHKIEFGYPANWRIRKPIKKRKSRAFMFEMGSSVTQRPTQAQLGGYHRVARNVEIRRQGWTL